MGTTYTLPHFEIGWTADHAPNPTPDISSERNGDIAPHRDLPGTECAGTASRR